MEYETRVINAHNWKLSEMKQLLTLFAVFSFFGNVSAQQAVPSIAYTATCKDVIEAKDQTEMERSMISVRELAFKSESQFQASTLYKALQANGVKNPLFFVLDKYEADLIPARNDAGMTFDHVIADNGGLKNVLIKHCTDQKNQMVNFYAEFYRFVLENKTDINGKPVKQP